MFDDDRESTQFKPKTITDIVMSTTDVEELPKLLLQNA